MWLSLVVSVVVSWGGCGGVVVVCGGTQNIALRVEMCFFLLSKSRVKLEILNLTMAHGMGHLFYLSTVFNHFTSVLLSVYAK